MCNYIESKSKNYTIIGPQFYRIYPGGQLFDSIQNDYGIQIPTTFEEWESRYKVSANRCDYLDQGVNHPWIKNKDLFLTQNAYKIVQILTFDDKDIITRKIIKFLILPIKFIVKRPMCNGGKKIAGVFIQPQK